VGACRSKLNIMTDEPATGDAASDLDNDRAPNENALAGLAGRQRGTHMGFARTLATILFVLALPVALVTTNVRLLANAPLVYDYAFDRYDAEETTALSREDLDATGAALRDYFNNGEDVFFHTVTIEGLETPVFNARETEHMRDVKDLFVLLNRAQEVTAVYVLLYAVVFFIWAREGQVRQLAGQALLGLGIGVLALGAVGVVAAFGFESAFERFHLLAFSNDLWKLDPDTDRLIQMFPEPFWRDMTIALGVMSAVEAMAIAAVAGVYLMGTRGERRRLDGSLDVSASSTQAA
jgi:integral membrane protein (TIGR01906 family)